LEGDKIIKKINSPLAGESKSLILERGKKLKVISKPT
jgi:hypothetical protein